MPMETDVSGKNLSLVDGVLYEIPSDSCPETTVFYKRRVPPQRDYIPPNERDVSESEYDSHMSPHEISIIQDHY